MLSGSINENSAGPRPTSLTPFPLFVVNICETRLIYLRRSTFTDSLTWLGVVGSVVIRKMLLISTVLAINIDIMYMLTPSIIAWGSSARDWQLQYEKLMLWINLFTIHVLCRLLWRGSIHFMRQGRVIWINLRHNIRPYHWICILIKCVLQLYE